jgi:protein-tyrosine-phosphatase
MPMTVLFACNLNSVRSPMAAAILRAAGPRYVVESAGVYDGGLDSFVEIVLGEIGVTLKGHEPKRLGAIDLSKVDVVVALTGEAEAELRRRLPAERIEVWRIRNPSDAIGGREAILEAYREVRDELKARIRARFFAADQKP